MRARGWEGSVQAVLGRDVSAGPHGLSVLIPCKGGCGETITYDTPKIMSPEGLRRKLTVDGWRLDRRRACPKCNAPKAHKEDEVATEKPTLTVVAAGAPSPTEAARAVRRAVLQWLEEGYDVAKQTYRAGITDTTIAKESGAAPEAVKKLREEFYGPLTEPSELAELREELGAIKAAARAAQEKFSTELSALNGRQKVVEDKLARYAKAQGWAA